MADGSERERPSRERRNLRILIRAVRNLRRANLALASRVEALEDERMDASASAEDDASTALAKVEETKPEPAKETPREFREMSPQAKAAALVNLMIGLIYLLIELLKSTHKL